MRFSTHLTIANACALVASAVWRLSRMHAAMQHRNSNDGIPNGNLLHKQQFGMFIVLLWRYGNALTCASSKCSDGVVIWLRFAVGLLHIIVIFNLIFAKMEYITNSQMMKLNWIAFHSFRQRMLCLHTERCCSYLFCELYFVQWTHAFIQCKCLIAFSNETHYSHWTLNAVVFKWVNAETFWLIPQLAVSFCIHIWRSAFGVINQCVQWAFNF